MIIDPYKEKRVSFVLNLEGTSHEKLDISMLIGVEDYELKVPMTIENGKVVGIIPKLAETKETLPEEVDVKVIVVAEGETFTAFETKMKVENEEQRADRIENIRREEAAKIEEEYKDKQEEAKKIAEDMVSEREKVRGEIDRLTAQKQVMEEVEVGWILKEEMARKKTAEYAEKKSFAERIAKGIREKKELEDEETVNEEKEPEVKVEENPEVNEEEVKAKREETEKLRSKFASKLEEARKHKEEKVEIEEKKTEKKLSRFAERLTS